MPPPFDSQCLIYQTSPTLAPSELRHAVTHELETPTSSQIDFDLLFTHCHFSLTLNVLFCPKTHTLPPSKLPCTAMHDCQNNRHRQLLFLAFFFWSPPLWSPAVLCSIHCCSPHCHLILRLTHTCCSLSCCSLQIRPNLSFVVTMPFCCRFGLLYYCW